VLAERYGVGHSEQQRYSDGDADVLSHAHVV
jgi:hypothetical protein